MFPSPDNLPLIHDGDSFEILLEVHDTFVQILSVLRYEGNTNSSPVQENFRDLRPDEKRAVIVQVNRRHKGMMVKT